MRCDSSNPSEGAEMLLKCWTLNRETNGWPPDDARHLQMMFGGMQQLHLCPLVLNTGTHHETPFGNVDF